MPPKSPSTGSRGVAGLASVVPLAIALLHSAIVPTDGKGVGVRELAETTSVEPVVCGQDIEDYLACHSEYPTACNSTGNYDAFLNLLKNQVDWTDSQVQKWFTALDDVLQLESRIPAGLGKANHIDNLQQLRALGEGKIYGVVGYLYGVKAEGKESSNCQLEPGEDNENVDFHTYIGFDSGVAARVRGKTASPADKSEMNPKSMIVEMTPHYRARYHPEWSLDALRKELGKQVRVTGQLMADNEHYVKSQDCGRKDHTASCWRATVWELHPITKFEVCSIDSCSETSAGWLPLGGGADGEIGSEAPLPKTGRARQN